MNLTVHEWISSLRSLQGAGERAVLVTVAGVRGSTPRETGAKMLVCENETLGTIGGGELEYQSTQIACERLRDVEANARQLRRFPLGSNCGQCCGGVVDVLFEECSLQYDWFDELLRVFDSGQPALIVTQLEGEFLKDVVAAHRVAEIQLGGISEDAVIRAARTALEDGNSRIVKLGGKRNVLIEPVTTPEFDIAVFGAGHVGTATVAMLAPLDCNIRWIDNRRNRLPANVPANVQLIRTDTPEREVEAMAAGAFYLTMTHSHALDYEICRNVLNRGDFAYCGLIGSQSKQRRFTKRMRQEEVRNIDRLICPIGISGISGKKPTEIAIAVAAELLQVRETASQSVADGSDANVIYIESRSLLER